jgi:hypothetical protein
MPILHIKLQPANNGITKVILDRDIRSQELILRKAVVLKPNINYTQPSFKIRLPFLAGNEIHSNDSRSFLTIPNHYTSRVVDTDFNLKLGAEHIANEFEAQVVDSNNSNIVSSTDTYNEIHLYFDYTSNSLF